MPVLVLCFATDQIGCLSSINHNTRFELLTQGKLRYNVEFGRWIRKVTHARFRMWRGHNAEGEREMYIERNRGGAQFFVTFSHRGKRDQRYVIGQLVTCKEGAAIFGCSFSWYLQTVSVALMFYAASTIALSVTAIVQ